MLILWLVCYHQANHMETEHLHLICRSHEFLPSYYSVVS